MSKTIKVEDGVYRDLDQLRLGRQTFGDVLKDLLAARLMMLKTLPVLEGALRFREWQREQAEKMSTMPRDGQE